MHNQAIDHAIDTTHLPYQAGDIGHAIVGFQNSLEADPVMQTSNDE